MESPILTYRPLRQLLKTDSYRAGHLCTGYIPMKFQIITSVGMWLRIRLPVQFLKYEADFGDCLSE